MGLFGKILENLSLGKKAKAATIRPTMQAGTKLNAPLKAPPSPPPPPKPAAPVAVPVVDVVAQLEAKAAAHPQKLNWKVSIVDLLKLLDLDHSLAARKELAVELGCPAEKMKDSAHMNMWLHKTVLQKLADNGGNIPKDLLD